MSEINNLACHEKNALHTLKLKHWPNYVQQTECSHSAAVIDLRVTDHSYALPSSDASSLGSDSKSRKFENFL